MTDIDNAMQCPWCGNIALVETGSYTENNTLWKQLRCESCGHYEQMAANTHYTQTRIRHDTRHTTRRVSTK